MAIKSRSMCARVLVARRQPQAKCQALDVSVHDNPRGDAEGGAQNDVGRFAADARQAVRVSTSRGISPAWSAARRSAMVLNR